MANKKPNELSKIIIENFRAVWLLVFVSLILVFTAKQDFLANFIWQKYRSPNLALLIVRNDADLAMFIGNYYFNGGNYDLGKAKAAFEKALRIDSSVLGPRYQLARVYFLNGDYAGALDFINEELKLHPDFKRSHYVRGLIYGYNGDLARAEEDFKMFLEWDPRSWAGYNDLAWIYFRQGNYLKVKETALTGLQWNSDNPWLLTSYGVAMLNTGERKTAGAILTKALSAAQKLTLEDWQKAYPGNHPSIAPEGLNTLIGTIRKNIQLTVDK